MQALRIAAMQFENASGDKHAKQAAIREVTRQAANTGANVVAFTSASVTG